MERKDFFCAFSATHNTKINFFEKFILLFIKEQRQVEEDVTLRFKVFNGKVYITHESLHPTAGVVLENSPTRCRDYKQ